MGGSQCEKVFRSIGSRFACKINEHNNIWGAEFQIANKIIFDLTPTNKKLEIYRFDEKKILCVYFSFNIRTEAISMFDFNTAFECSMRM